MRSNKLGMHAKSKHGKLGLALREGDEPEEPIYSNWRDVVSKYEDVLPVKAPLDTESKKAAKKRAKMNKEEVVRYS